ncbi:hypothetical protein V1264_013197 [Littorina saxatilis]|uniref:Uncharacterized protein n=1 Tax=Littorina saxatilis TaxID=31220 RepID=A0AAN9BSX2_9CAEN
MSLNRTTSAHVSRKDKALGKSFYFGLPLDRLPCTYLPDCGYVPTFVVEAGQIIEKSLDVEGLFGKSGDLRQQNKLKARNAVLDRF